MTKKSNKLKSNYTKVTLTLDSSLLKSVETALVERGTDIETYIRLQLRAFNKAKALLGLRDKMTFGKYAGECVEDICRAEPQYMNWIIAESTTAKFDHTVTQLLEELG